MLNFSMPRLPAAIDFKLNLSSADVQEDLKKSVEEKETLEKDSQKELFEIIKNQIHRKKAQKDLHLLHKDQDVALQKHKEMLQTAKEKQKEKEVIDRKKLHLSRILNLYEKNLSFRIKKIKIVDVERNEYPLCFTFGNIKNNPQESFSLVLSTDGQNYKVLNCKPMIDSLDELTSELNESNDLSKFIIQVRRKFCRV